MPSANEAKLALEGFYAYCGTFEVNAEDGYVTHHLEIASTPNDVGRNLRRRFDFEGERLTLRPTETDSSFTGGSLTWERVR